MRSVADAPLQLDVFPGRLTGEDLVEAQVELVLLRHLREPPIGRLVLGEGDEDHLVRLPSTMPDQFHERTRDLGPDVPFPVLHQRIKLRLLPWLEGRVGNRSEHRALLRASGCVRSPTRTGWGCTLAVSSQVSTPGAR